MNNLEIFPPSKPPGIDLDDLMRPDLAFDSPMDVVNDPDLTLHEKRAILASWASDAQAVDSAPSLRNGPAGRQVSIDEILAALRALDRKRDGLRPWVHKQVRRSSIEKFRTGRVRNQAFGGADEDRL